MKKVTFVAVAIVFAIVTIIAVSLISFKTVEGGSLGVKETWGQGVVNEVLQPKNYPLWFTEKIYTYDARLLVYELPDYTIKSSDNQEMTIRSKVQWRRDPSKLVQHHRMFKQNAEQNAINPAMIGAILRHATEYKALDAYSGDGLNRMQKDIGEDLMSNQELKNDGILIESYIIEYNHLKPEYLEMINTRQLALLKQSAAIEQQKAAEAQALVAKAEAQQNLNKAVVEAQRDKEVMILAAQAQQEKQILAAKGQQQQLTIEAEGAKAKLIAEAEGKKQAMLATAEGTLAMGKAEAAAKRAMLEAYAVQGSEAWVRTEVAKSLASAFSNIKGYIPEKMSLNVLADSFNKAVDVGTGHPVITQPASGSSAPVASIGQ